LGHENNLLEPTYKEHLYTTIGLFLPILACGVFVSDLGLLYQLIGGFCSTSLAYIFPALCYFLIFWRKPIRSHNDIVGDEDDEDEHGQDCFDDEDSDENEEDDLTDSDDDDQAMEDVEGQKKKKILLETAEQKRTRRRKERAILSASEHSQHPLQETTPILSPGIAHPVRPSSYGGTATVHHHHFSTLSPSTSTSSAESVGGFAAVTHANGSRTGTLGRRARRRNSSIKMKKGETELWLDVSAGILLVFGVFVMILSTIITLKKMAGYM
jgi:hypothetical protein